MPDQPGKMMPALYGGIVIAVISTVPFLSLINCLCCAGGMLGGFLAVFFYTKDMTAQSPPLTNSLGLQLGALAGLFGALIGTVLNILILATIGNVSSQVELDILRGFEDSMPPGTLEQIEESMEQSGGLGMISILTSFFTSIIIDPLFGLIGGLIGYSFYKNKVARPPAPPAVPPPTAV